MERLERYFVVTEKSSLHNAWFAYKENLRVVNEVVKKFKELWEIEANGYYVNNESFYIVPTGKDAETFKSVLCSPIENGLRKFRTTSKIGKSWVKTLKDAELNVMHKPMVILYFKSFGGRYRSRLFDQNDVLYCSIEPSQGEAPEGFIEIKASEFFKIIEESEKMAVRS